MGALGAISWAAETFMINIMRAASRSGIGEIACNRAAAFQVLDSSV